MLLKRILVTCLLLVGLLAAKTSAETINVSREFTSAASGSPRVVFDSKRDYWVVAWRKGNLIQARLIQKNGHMSASKILARAVNSEEQNFDLAVGTRKDASQILAFEDSTGLEVRAIPSLNPGEIHLIESDAKASIPRLVFDQEAGQYFIFWLGTQDGSRSALRERIVSKNGKPLGETVTLASAESGQTFGSLKVARKSDGSMTAILFERSNGAGSVLKVNISSDGKLQSSPRPFQKSTAGLNTIGDIAFSKEDTGFGIWVDKTSLKLRKVTASGAFGGRSHSILSVVPTDSDVISISYDPYGTQFDLVWTNENEIMAGTLDRTTGEFGPFPFSVTTSILGFVRNVNVVSNGLGQTLVVWEDSTTDKEGKSASFVIRASFASPWDY